MSGLYDDDDGAAAAAVDAAPAAALLPGAAPDAFTAGEAVDAARFPPLLAAAAAEAAAAPAPSGTRCILKRWNSSSGQKSEVANGDPKEAEKACLQTKWV